MSDTNGVIRMARKGKKKFAFGDGEPFEIEVVVAYNRWVDIDDQFRNEKNEHDPATRNARNEAAHAFVQSLTKTEKNPNGEEITLSEALEFLARLTEEARALFGFFVPREPEKQSSQERLEVRFST